MFRNVTHLSSGIDIATFGYAALFRFHTITHESHFQSDYRLAVLVESKQFPIRVPGDTLAVSAIIAFCEAPQPIFPPKTTSKNCDHVEKDQAGIVRFVVSESEGRSTSSCFAHDVSQVHQVVNGFVGGVP